MCTDGGREMGPTTPFIAVLLSFAHKPVARRMEAVENLPKDRVMTRAELIRHGLLSDNYVN